jgi:hypothetical protein
VEKGRISDNWRPLTPAELVPVGRARPIRTEDGRPMDQAWIEALIANTPEHEIDVRVHGGWEFRSVDRYFTVFRDGGTDSHVHARYPSVEFDLVLGIDHGSRPGKQIAVLMAVWKETVVDKDGRTTTYTRVYVIDEYVDETGLATPADDARGVLNMLARYGWTWGDLKFAGGDRVHMPGSGRQKSNKDLAAQIAKLLQVPPDALHPPIRTIKRGEGRGANSVEVRARWLFHRMAEGGFGVHPRCKRVRASLATTDLSDDDAKDPFDGVVYGLDPYIFPRMAVATTVRLG